MTRAADHAARRPPVKDGPRPGRDPQPNTAGQRSRRLRPPSVPSWLRRAVLLSPYVLLPLLAAVWFAPVREGVVAFDDVGAILRWTDPEVGLLDRTVLDTTANRWRPVFTVVFTGLTASFGKDYSAYFWFNVTLTAALAVLLYRLLLAVSSRVVVALVLTVVAVTSRFAYYQVTQVIGPLEALSLLFLLLLVAALLRFERAAQPRDLWFAVAAFTLIVHTHERYVALVAFLVPLVLTARSLAPRARLLWAAAFVLPVMVNLVVRRYLLEVPLLVGSGSSTELGFTWQTGLRHVAYGSANVLGVNYGPDYLNGLVYPNLSPALKTIAVALAVAALALASMAFLLSERPDGLWFTAPGPRRWIALGVLLIGVLIACSAVTIRVEPRWLYAPFLVVLVVIAYASSIVLADPRARRGGFAALAIVLLGSVVLDVQYQRNLDGVYFMAARASAADLVDKTLGRHGAALSRAPVYVIDPAPDADWQATLSPILQANADQQLPEIVTVGSLEDVPSGDGLIYDVTGGFHQLTFPATGFLPVGDLYGDGWAGREFGLRGACSGLSLTVRPFRPGPDRSMVVTPGAGRPRTVALTEPEVVLELSEQEFGGRLNVRFDRTFVPRDEGVSPDVRELAARAEVLCRPAQEVGTGSAPG